MHWKLYEGDCLEQMHHIEDASVQLIIVDLPYGTTACKWDSCIPFEPLWEHYNRILTKNGTVCMFGSEPFATIQRMAQLDKYKYDWIWNKNKFGNGVHIKNNPGKVHEVISVFSNGVMNHIGQSKNRMEYNPQGLIELDTPKITKRKRDDGNITPVRMKNLKTTQKYTNYPTSILKFPVKGKRYHPTQKPTELYEYLVKTYSNDGDTVLDNCAGSGTLGVSCMELNRNVIMIEQEQKYIDIIKDRMEE